MRGYIGKCVWTVLSQQANAAGPGQHEVGLEIVVEIDRHHALGQRRYIGWPAGEGNLGPGGQAHLAAIRHCDNRRARTAQRNRADPIPLGRLVCTKIGEWLRIEGERGVRRRRSKDRRLETQEVSEGLGLVAGRRLDRGQALTIFGHAHHHVAQKCCLRRGGMQVRAGCGRLHCRQLMLHFRRPCRRTSADLRHCRFQSGSIAALGRDAAQLKQRSQIVRLSSQNLLQQLLNFGRAVFIALPFSFFRQPVEGP